MAAYVIRSDGKYYNGDENRSTWADLIELAEVVYYPDFQVFDVEKGDELIQVKIVPAYNSCKCPFCGNRVLHAKLIE